MRFALFFLIAAFARTPVHAQRTPGGEPPRIDERVAEIAQSAPLAPWAFIGYAIIAPAQPGWFVAIGTPRGGSMGRRISRHEAHTAVLVLSSEVLDKPVESDAALLEITRARHAKLGGRWQIDKHDETIARHADTRCARHALEATEPEDRSPRKDADKTPAPRSSMFVVGIACVHPTDSRVLVEVGMSERGRTSKVAPEVVRVAEEVIASLSFHRFSEQALQKSAQAARSAGLADAEAILKPYIDADAAWARYYLAQVVERAKPATDNAGARIRALLEPAAEKGLTDAQWSLGTLYLRGAPGVSRDPARAEALLRRAAERGNPGAAYQLGISLLSGTDGIAGNKDEAVLWIQRAAVRGQKEAQEMLKKAQAKPAAK